MILGLKIRLTGGKNNSQGRVELNYDGTWGSICDYQFDTEEARVICQQMGFIDGHAFKNSYFGNGTGPVYITDLACTGNETTLLSCPNAGWNTSYELCAGHSHDAAVSCYGEGMSASIEFVMI